MADDGTSDDRKTNTIDPDRLKKIIADIETKIDAKLSHKMEYVESCKSFNEAIANAYEMGAAFVPKKILKAKIKERELRRKIDDIPEDFEEDDRELFEQITQALGGYADTPLGQAAVDAASKTDSKPRSRKKAEADPDAQAAADNAGRLTSGIKGLPGADAPGKHQVQ